MLRRARNTAEAGGVRTEQGGLNARVLVADDVPDAALSLALLLEYYGAEARYALDGAEAVRLAEDFRPEVLLVDISMPRMDGYQVARAIRAAPWGADMILLALTGWGRSSDQEAARAAGFDGHLLKPVSADALIAEIGKIQARCRSVARGEGM
jgi:two-component system, sensor histidine kinase